MVKLPFVVQPKAKPRIERIGNEETGVIEIERRGYLTVAEKVFVQTALSQDTSNARFYALIGQVAKELKIDYKVVLEDLQNNDLKKYKKWEDKLYAGVSEMSNFNEMSKMVAATALINSRINSEWTMQETMNDLHPDLLDPLKDLYDKEESKSQEALIDIAEDLEEDNDQDASSEVKE
jgi:hypothetical protein